MANIYTITYPKNENVFIHVMAGHFISANNHINYYVCSIFYTYFIYV